MTKILAFAGRKQSGKNTAFNFLLGLEMIKLAIVRDKFAVMDNGKLWISDIFGENEYEGIFDVERKNETMISFLNEYVYPYIKNYSFADKLKNDICINILGLTHRQCFGSDEDKDSKTHLKWEDMPGVICDKGIVETLKTREVRGRLGTYYKKLIGNKGGHLVYHEKGFMTAREVLQFVGTELFRKMYSNVWADSCVRQIKEEDSMFAVITDCRFPNEVEAVQKAGGKVIRLTRNMSNSDCHESERALDPENYNWENFDAVIDNENLSIGEQNAVIAQILEQWEWIESIRNIGDK